MNEIAEDPGHGRRLADALEDTITQAVAGNLLKFRAIEIHLEAGRVTRAQGLMQEVTSTQRDILDELRMLAARLTGPDPLSP